jgi:hypothetical protein
MDRLFAYLLFLASLLAGAGAVVLVINGFVDWLVTERWESLSLLQLGYDTYMIKAQWFLANRCSWPVHDVLAVVPVYAALLGFAPIAWWCSNFLAKR